MFGLFKNKVKPTFLEVAKQKALAKQADTYQKVELSRKQRDQFDEHIGTHPKLKTVRVNSLSGSHLELYINNTLHYTLSFYGWNDGSYAVYNNINHYTLNREDFPETLYNELASVS